MKEYVRTTRYTVKALDEISVVEDFSDAKLALFDEREMEVDDSIYIDDGHLRLSSNRNGIVEWNEGKGQYEHHYYGSVRPLGQLIGLAFPNCKDVIVIRELKQSNDQ